MLAENIGIKRIRGSEIELLRWLKENSTLHIIEIENYQYNIQNQGFRIYYKKETKQ